MGKYIIEISIAAEKDLSFLNRSGQNQLLRGCRINQRAIGASQIRNRTSGTIKKVSGRSLEQESE